MSYQNGHLTRIIDLKTLAQAMTLAEQILKTRVQTLETRQDANVNAATDSSEVIDARIDTWGNEHDSAGTCIRSGQVHTDEVIAMLNFVLQKQIDQIAAAIIDTNANFADVKDKLRG